MTRTRLPAATALILSAGLLIGSCSTETDQCRGAPVRDPGRVRAVELHGIIRHDVGPGPLAIAGKTVRVDATTRVYDVCNNSAVPCEGRVVLRAHTADTADTVFSWGMDKPVVSVFSINTNEFRLANRRLVLADGSTWRLAPDFEVSGCGLPQPAAFIPRAIMRHGVGVTFRVDAATEQALSAGCNGCA